MTQQFRFAIVALGLVAAVTVADDDDCPDDVEGCMTVVGERTTTGRTLASWETTSDCWRFVTDQYTARISSNHAAHRAREPDPNRRRRRGGIDVVVVNGTPVYPLKSGVVQVAYDLWDKDDPANSGDNGNFVRIDYHDGTQGVFLHLESVAVSDGDTVSVNDVIGTSNNTGKSSGAHLHYTQWNEDHSEQEDPELEHPNC